MTLLTTAFLLERYGPLLTEADLGEVLHLAPGTVRTQRALGTLPVQCVKRGGSVYFHAQDVAEYVDSLRGRVGRAA